MEDYGFGPKRIAILMLAIGMAGAGLLWFLSRLEWVLGFELGVMTALAYTLLLRYQMHKAGAMPTAKALTYLKGSWVPRFILVIAAVLYCLHIPGVKMIAMVGGLFIPFRLIVLINSIVLIHREYSFKGVQNRHAV